MRINKQQIDSKAEAEALALKRSDRRSNVNDSRTRQQSDYNQCAFEKLFTDKLYKRRKNV